VIEMAQRAEAAGAHVLLATDHLGNWGALSRLQIAAEATNLRSC
jgi:alkanesulfonate monooxygenase SsuD/methylene tetrahydromethanopterin reductase-like flavin-dependent oxidoreductase (luciferase family)